MKIGVQIGAAISLFFLTSCGTFLYHPVTPKSPCLKAKNDFCGEFNICVAGFQTYAAYSPLKYIGVSTAIAMDRYPKDTVKLIPEKRFQDCEISLIPYYPYREMCFKMPFGMGVYSFTTSRNRLHTNTLYTRQYIQPTFSFRYACLDLSAYLRITRLKYTNVVYGVDMRYEPGFMACIGTDKVKFIISQSLDFGTNHSALRSSHLALEDQLLYFPFYSSVGVQFSLNFNKSKPIGQGLQNLVF